MSGVIYILTNPSFPDYVKIGYADDMSVRLKQLNNSECTPFAFRVYATYEVHNRLKDLQLHNLIDKLNPDLRSIDTVEGKKRVREFYAMTPEDAYELLDAIAEISGTSERLQKYEMTDSEKEQQETADEVSRTIAERFKFSLCGIKEGEVIEFCYDPSITCTVFDDTHVQYENQTYSLSALAQKLTNNEHGHIAGPRYFKYRGEWLNDVRRRFSETEDKGTN